ncbi:hypothetical protein HSX10_10105 [Winogradskyella undariae]|uniref:hypothetical protein n=1 Tax=Winogradskyella TaxID=286104 RepID=UPI00156A7C06|nr:MULTISPECIES: hypothetical protein [Winogradskyella]NRR91916.1 hypothetical protein [Winogradskyella undariae]QXP78121.1 hypothetical protein H0I32_12950 [Winogradskyella sp. HaHa_3_26]
MKIFLIITVALTCFSGLLAQQKETDSKTISSLKMESEYSSDIEEVSDLLSFEGIDYMKLKFSGEQLKGKSYKLTVKEIWDGKIVSDTIVMDSRSIGVKQFETLSDTVFKMKVISKHTDDNQLKMTFKFPRFSITKNYEATDSENYSLRNLVEESNLEISYNKSFYLLAYILPYEREDGLLSWCDVGTAGAEIEKWGKQFGIKHYLLFEMKFE